MFTCPWAQAGLVQCVATKTNGLNQSIERLGGCALDVEPAHVRGSVERVS